MMGIVYGQAKSATPEPSAFGTILIPSYGRRVGKSSEYFVHTNGRFSTATETSSLKNVINVTEMARAPQSLSWLDNFRARAAYFRTWAIGDFYIDLLFENTSSALNTTVYVGKDGWFSGYSTIATKEKERVFYRAKDIPLKTYISLAEEEGYAIVSDVDDTIKVTNVLSKLGAIPNLFAKTFMTTPGMPDYYASLSTGLAINTSEGFYSKPTFHYLTASPVQYLPALQPFLEQFYPRGEVLANVFSMGTASQLTSYYTFKVTGGSTIHAFFPKKQLILVGDSTQKGGLSSTKPQMRPHTPNCIKNSLIPSLVSLSEMYMIRSFQPKIDLTSSSPRSQKTNGMFLTLPKTSQLLMT